MSSIKENCPESVCIDIAILAHNEAEHLPLMLADLMAQTALCDPALDIRIAVLANGCSDDTADVARRAVASPPLETGATFEVLDFAEPGKSRTMNRFLREILRPEATLVTFMDGDIRLPRHDTLARMVSEMEARAELQVFVSRPVKDIVYHGTEVGFVARLIAAGSEGLTDYRRSIAGSLFMLRAEVALRLSLPAGLPVEDGFIRAMLLTDFLSSPEDISRIDGDENVFHLYEAVQTISALVQHQTRLVVGGERVALCLSAPERRRGARRGHSVAAGLGGP